MLPSLLSCSVVVRPTKPGSSTPALARGAAVEADRWIPLATTAPPNTVQIVNSLVYHAAEHVFLMKETVDLRNVYVCGSSPRSRTDQPPGGPPFTARA